jgi:hypothetical protein
MSEVPSQGSAPLYTDVPSPSHQERPGVFGVPLPRGSDEEHIQLQVDASIRTAWKRIPIEKEFVRLNKELEDLVLDSASSFRRHAYISNRLASLAVEWLRAVNPSSGYPLAVSEVAQSGMGSGHHLPGNCIMQQSIIAGTPKLISPEDQQRMMRLREREAAWIRASPASDPHGEELLRLDKELTEMSNSLTYDEDTFERRKALFDKYLSLAKEWAQAKQQAVAGFDF